MRKAIILSGGNTTQGLTEKLIDKYDIAILEPQIAGAHSQRFGDKVIPIGRLIDQNLQNQALNVAAQMAGNVSASGMPYIVSQIEAQKEWARFRGNGFANDIGQWFPAYLYMTLSRQIMQVFALDRLLQERKVALVVTHEDVTEMYGGLAVWGNARGIPTMHVPHGNSFMQRDYGPDVHEQSISTCIAATPHEETFYRERGYAGEVRLTGSPLFDKWVGIERDKAWARRMFRLDADKPVVVYLSSWGQRTNANDDLAMFERSFDAMMLAAKDTDWQVLVKMHPGEAPGMEENYAKRAQVLGVRRVITKQYLDIALLAADVAVSVGATNSLVDAALIGVPGISINCIGFRMNHPAIREVEPDTEAVRREIAFVLSDEGRKSWNAYREDFVYQMAFQNDGKATERVARWICEKAE